MGMFDWLFKKKEVEQTPDREAWQMGAGKAASDWATKYLSQFVPGEAYTGKLSVPMASGEQKGQQYLMKFLDQADTGEMFKLASEELKKTLTGGYDPSTSPYYKATRQAAVNELEDAITTARRGQGYRGSFFQDTALREENKLRERTTNYLDQILGQMAETERGRRFAAVEPAMALEEYGFGIPLKKATAGMGLGSLPRIIEEAELEKRYQDYVRQREEMKLPLQAAQTSFATPVNYGVKTYEAPSPFERIMQSVMPIVGQVAGSKGTLNPFKWFT